MQLGFVSAILFDQTLEQVLEIASDIGYDCVEVMCWPHGDRDRKFGGVSHLDVQALTPERVEATWQMCRERGVGISGLGYYPNPLSADADEAEFARSHLKKVIDASAALGLKLVNTFIGANTQVGLQENLALFRSVWPELIDYAAEREVRVAIENCPMLFSDREWPFGANLGRSPAIWREMFETINSPYFGLNYDPSHFVLQLMDPLKPIFAFGEKLFHTHAKDMRVNRDELDDRGVLAFDWATPKLPGLGDVHWGQWVGALADVGFEGAVCVEVEDDAFTKTFEDRLRSLRLSYNVLRTFVH